MNLIATNAGSYPRIGDTPEKQVLRRVITQWEKGEKSGEDLAAAEKEMTKLAISEQLEAGLDLITDGQIRWYDLLSHIAGKLEGIKINGLLRFFDTNSYYRQPVVSGEIKHKKTILLDDYRFAQSISSKPVKPLITGPYTLAKLSIVENGRYKSFEKLVEDYSVAVAEEVKALASAGATIIQIDEPAILKNKEDVDLFSSALRLLVNVKGNARLALSTYFGDVAWLYRTLQESPADILGIDFTYNQKLASMIARDGSKKPLALGLIDGRNTRMDDEKEVRRDLDLLLPAIKGESCYLNPSCGLEYLPRDRAFMKLQNLARIAASYKS
jgi:5-methyltetrahydropteroyltriglutamate--homocysteine methyltransferase